MANPPLIYQGTLNRVRTSVIIPSIPSLNIVSSYMGKSLCTVTFDGNFSGLIGTATGAVPSPEPYVFSSAVISLLRTQALSAAWVAQSQTTSTLGDNVTVISDSSAFQPIVMDDCVIHEIEPGVFDGMDPIVRLTLRGIFRINSDLWNFV